MSQNRRSFMKSLAAAGTWAAAGAQPRSAYAFEKDILTLGTDGITRRTPVLQKKTGTKLQRIETYTQGTNVSFVRVQTDDGAEGWGQISTFDADISAQVLHRKIARLALGQDPADLEKIVDRCVEENYKFPWSFICRAVAGLDTAVWDLLGKREQLSVCELLGGRPRPFPVYGSSMSRTITPEDEGKRLARLRGEKGFRAFKIRAGKVNGHDEDQWPGRTEQLIPAVRKAVGEDIQLLIDGNSGYTPPKAIEVGRMLEQYNYCHFEEPCPYWELEWTAEVARAVSVPVAGGEQDNDLAQWRRMIDMRAVDVVQPDILYIGGLTRALRVAAKAAEKNLPCVPHSANLAMVTVFTLHLMGAIPNAGDYVEFSIESTPWTDGLYHPALEVKDGHVAIPSGPGWGVTINPAWLAKAERQVSDLG
ncbi:MAG TPA: mandelate racemase/muconate lactonizing enzyme family protein [bacterium]|nr:mandelate racemase/muconate lactonizing enzyme family protein [bacterium]